jgi:hypothetical protein
MKEPDDIRTSLEVLRETTLKWGMVLKPQADNLEMWIRLAVPEASEHRYNVDVDRFLVEYEVDVPRETPEPREVLDGMSRSIRWMLGEGWDVEVRAQGWVYRSKGDVSCRKISRNRQETPVPRPSGSSTIGKPRR